MKGEYIHRLGKPALILEKPVIKSEAEIDADITKYLKNNIPFNEWSEAARKLWEERKEEDGEEIKKLWRRAK